MRWCVWCVMAGALLIGGCTEQSAPAQPQQKASRFKSPPKPPEPPPPPDKGPEPPYPRGGKMQLKSDPLGGPARVEDTTQVKAAVGAGAKGRSLEDPKLVQMIVTPAVVLFRVEERLAYEAKVPYALKLYEAEHGRKPKTHEEFVEQILKPNQINLPELPPGHRYIYDPQAGELMVEKPAG